MAYTLSLLDKSPIPPGGSAEQALAGTLALARRADALGYRRFWVAEHHHSETLAGSAPEILVAHLLAQTRRIRIGSGGVMLQHYSPYKVAEQFRVLCALAPGRVDLGVGKAPGGLPLSTRALQSRIDPARTASFADLLAELDTWLGVGPPAGHPLHEAQATPSPLQGPERVLLGGSPGSAELAARHGWQFCYAGHFNGDPANIRRSVDTYAQRAGRAPLLALFAVAAETAAAAAQLVGSLKMVRLHLPDPTTGLYENGQSVNLPTLTAAGEFARQAGATDYRTEERTPHVVSGSAAQVREQLAEFAYRYGVEELVIDNPVPGYAQRLTSVELLADPGWVTAAQADARHPEAPELRP